MLGNILPPYHSLQELNLDWILTKVKNILRFVPDDGAVGQILRRTRYGAEWSDEQGAGGSVTSVNGQQGAVVLDAADVGALPDSTVIPDSTSDLINDSGFVDAAGAAAAAPVQSVNGMTGDVVISGGGAVDSVNGQTGTVVLDAADVGALPDSYVAPVTSVNGQTGAVSISIPDSTSDLINDSGFVDAAGAAAAAPVQSVNGQTGDVVVSGAEWDEPVITGISFPFIPDVDGIMSVIIVPPSNSVSYFYIDDSTINAAWSRGYVTGYFPYTQTFPVVKGHRYFIVAQQNAGTPTIRFTPLK